MSRSRRSQSGQSMVLFAFLIITLIGMVALSVDGGNVYAEQRRVQSVTNAGALAAMQAAQAQNATNNKVWTSVQRALHGNRVDVDGKLYSYRVDYVLNSGAVQLLGEWDGTQANVRSGTSVPPSNIERIQVTMTETVPTYFASVIGHDTLDVSANGVACVGNYGPGVYPLGIPYNLLKYQTSNRQSRQYHRIYKADGSELSPNNANWGNWSTMQGMSVYLPVENWSDSAPGTHMAWFSWDGSNGANELKAGLTYPGTLQNGFTPADPLDNTKPNTEPASQLTLGDWVNGDTGVKATVQGELDALINAKRDLILPMYSDAGKDNGKTAFRVVKMGYFRLVGADMNGGSKYIRVQYLGEATATPSECGSEAPPNVPGRANEKYAVEGTVQVDRAWRKLVPSSRYTNDIVLVMDTSTSMSWDWNDQNSGAQYQRLNDAKKVLNNFMRYYDVSQATGDPDARIALVTFGGSRNESSGLRVNATTWATACSTVATAVGCTEDQKWATWQTQVTNLQPAGLTPGPLAFEKVEALLRDKRSVPANKIYSQVVVFATDGVFNVCGNEPAPQGAQACPSGYVVPGNNINEQLYSAPYNMGQGRPIWQAQQVASRIKAAGAKIFTIALTPTCPANSTTCFNPAGLPEMSSGEGYRYQANDGQALDQIYAKIRGVIVDETCVPYENREFAKGVKVTLTKPGNTTWKMEATTDNGGNYKFAQKVEAGQYTVTVAPMSITSAEDGERRTYSRVRNGRDLAEEGQATVSLSTELRNDSTFYQPMLLSLPTTAEGTPHNGCSMP